MKDIAEMATEVFPLKQTSLVHCITNNVTIETMANALLYVNAQPIMTSDVREFPVLLKKIDSLLLNLGSLSKEREQTLLTAAKMSSKQIPLVVDIVGVTSAPIAYQLSKQLSRQKPDVIKGNISELRAFCGLKTTGKGVDSSISDQNEDELEELLKALKQEDLATTYLATGKKDIIVAKDNIWIMENGVNELQRFIGTGDVLGALIAALLGVQFSAESAVLLALSYLNICAEHASEKMISNTGLADFRHETLNQLSLLGKENKHWFRQARGGKR